MVRGSKRAHRRRTDAQLRCNGRVAIAEWARGGADGSFRSALLARLAVCPLQSDKSAPSKSVTLQMDERTRLLLRLRRVRMAVAHD